MAWRLGLRTSTGQAFKMAGGSTSEESRSTTSRPILSRKVAVDHAALDYELAGDTAHRDLAVFEEDGRHLSPLATALIKLLAIGTPAEAGPAGAREDVAL